MLIRGKLIAEAPIYRGNARKTLFTRDGDGRNRMVSLAGEVDGTAQALMDAFTGQSKNGRNKGLLNRLWERLYGQPMPEKLFKSVHCILADQCYAPDRFFDLRMGIRLDEDRWAVEANGNYKMETTFKNCVFDFSLAINDTLIEQNDNKARLFYLLRELEEGRFWFGAGKTKGLGRCRLQPDTPLPLTKAPALRSGCNHLSIELSFDAENPLLVGWNWGKLDPDQPSFKETSGSFYLQGVRQIPDDLKKRIELALGGTVSDLDDWLSRLDDALPRAVAAWIARGSESSSSRWVLPADQVAKMGKGKFPISKKLLKQMEPLLDKPFDSKEAIEAAFAETMGKMAKKARRALKAVQEQEQTEHCLDPDFWRETAENMGMPVETSAERINAVLDDSEALTQTIASLCQEYTLPDIHSEIKQRSRMLQSDAWVDGEIQTREHHLRIKQMLLQREIKEEQWGEPAAVPAGVDDAVWREFLHSHNRVQYRHMLNDRNLRKSITNDENAIAFLRGYRDKARIEISGSELCDYRAGGPSRRHISKEYGKPYDTVFMRMLSWSPSTGKTATWEAYIPGSTIKGAFRKRAAMVLGALWGEGRETNEVLDRLFGKQRQPGLINFSDAYLRNPNASDQPWCSLDAVRMDPASGAPVEEAKFDLLYAYGKDFQFKLRLDIADLNEQDMQAVEVLMALLADFQDGDIVLGGNKTKGLGWVKAQTEAVTWLCSAADRLGSKLFHDATPEQHGLWQKTQLENKAADAFCRRLARIKAKQEVPATPPQSASGYISHRILGGHNGILVLQGKLLTPLHIKESGEPSHSMMLGNERINGWDLFSMTPPDAERRGQGRCYAIPSGSLKGMIRHIYSITTDSDQESPSLDRLNPTDSLFGWVGSGPNQSIMGRVAFEFGRFDQPEFGWFKTPYPYGAWQWDQGRWKDIGKGQVRMHRIDNQWRIFPQAPLAPCVEQLADFNPDEVNASYQRAVLPGSTFTTQVRFWNLTDQELSRLLWCLVLDNDMGHKAGKGRYLGFGALQLRLLPESRLIDLKARYSKNRDNSGVPLDLNKLLQVDLIKHHTELRKLLNVNPL